LPSLVALDGSFLQYFFDQSQWHQPTDIVTARSSVVPGGILSNSENTAVADRDSSHIRVTPCI